MAKHTGPVAGPRRRQDRVPVPGAIIASTALNCKPDGRDGGTGSAGHRARRAAGAALVHGMHGSQADSGVVVELVHVGLQVAGQAARAQGQHLLESHSVTSATLIRGLL